LHTWLQVSFDSLVLTSTKVILLQCNTSLTPEKAKQFKHKLGKLRCVTFGFQLQALIGEELSG
jgi:hypothetical protein